MEYVIGFVIGFIVASWLAWTYGINEAKQQCVLDILSRAREPLYGLDIVAQSNGMLKVGTVYVTLGRMQDRGLIFATAPDVNGRRRYILRSIFK